MTTDQHRKPDDVVDARSAAAMLEVDESRIPVLVADGLLTPVDDRAQPVFAVADVMAVRELGG